MNASLKNIGDKIYKKALYIHLRSIILLVIEIEKGLGTIFVLGTLSSITNANKKHIR